MKLAGEWQGGVRLMLAMEECGLVILGNLTVLDYRWLAFMLRA